MIRTVCEVKRARSRLDPRAGDVMFVRFAECLHAVEFRVLRPKVGDDLGGCDVCTDAARIAANLRGGRA